jgi:SAM-dependent methyltransferase
VRRWNPAFRIVRCRDCSLLYMNPRPNADQLAALYTGDYYAGHADYSYEDERKVEPRVRIRAAGRLQRIERMLDADGIRTRRVIELGSAYGAFLDEARRRRWHTLGCEVSHEAASWTRAHRGLDIRECDLADAGCAPNSADFITGSEVIEHIATPRLVARAAFDILSPGGVILFSTANEMSLARLLRGRNWAYFMPGHVVLWSAKTLRRLLEGAGFDEVTVHAGDERGLANFSEFLHAGGPGTPTTWGLRRIRLGNFTLGAGMVVEGRKPR